VSLADAAARGASLTVAGQWIRFAVQLLALAALGRLLTPDDFGLIAMVLALVGVATLLSDFGLSMASVQSQHITQAQRSNLFWLNAALGLLIAGVVFALARPLADFYDRRELVDVCRVLALTILLGACAAQFKAETTRRLRFGWLVGAEVAAQVAASAAAIVVAVRGGGYWALVVQQLVAAAVALVVLVAASSWRPDRPRRSDGMRPLLGFGVNTLGVQVLNYASSNAGSVLIGRFWGADALGAYDRAYQIFRLPLTQVAAPMTRVALPILARVQSSSDFDRYVQRAQLLLAYGMGGAFLVAASLADPVIEGILGPGWDQSKLIFRVLAVGGTFQALGFVYHWIFLAKALTRLQLRYTVVTRTLMIALMAVGVGFGPVGVAVGSSAGLVLNWLVLTLLAAPRTGVAVRPLVEQAGRPLAVGAGLLAVSLPVTALVATLSVPLQLLVLIGTDAGYLALVLAAVPAVRADLALIWSTVRRIRRRRA
jgi:O-antigen/teichoic acid export membrane protein